MGEHQSGWALRWVVLGGQVGAGAARGGGSLDLAVAHAEPWPVRTLGSRIRTLALEGTQRV